MIVVRYADDLGGGIRAPGGSRAVSRGFSGAAGEVRAGAASGEDAADRVRQVRSELAGKRGEKEKPESFTFLGFTHYCGINRAGKFTIRRQTARKRLEAKLQQVKQTLRARMHEPVPKVGEWLRRVLNGFYQYHAVPGNWDSLKTFRLRIGRYWRHVLRRRSQRGRITAEAHQLDYSTAGSSSPGWCIPTPAYALTPHIRGKSRMVQ